MAAPGIARIHGTALAAGLDWFLPREGQRGLLARKRQARTLGYRLLATRAGEYPQFGGASPAHGHRRGMRAAAAAAANAAPPGILTWHGLFRCDDGAVLHVRVLQGCIAPVTGDRLFAVAEQAVAAFRRADLERSWDARYAPAELNLGVPEFPAPGWAASRRAPRLQDTAVVPRTVFYAAGAAAAAAAIAVVAPTVLEWMRPAAPPPAQPVLALPPPGPPPGIDSTRFLAACGRARARAEIPLPGWRRSETVCGDGADSAGLLQSGDGALLVRWGHQRSWPERMRRIAERRLAALDGARGLVEGRQAIAAAPVSGYGRKEAPLAADFAEVRAALDERLGPIATSLELSRAQDPAAALLARIRPFQEWNVALETQHPLAALAARPVAHLEWTALRWLPDDTLRAEGRVRIASGTSEGGS